MRNDYQYLDSDYIYQVQWVVAVYVLRYAVHETVVVARGYKQIYAKARALAGDCYQRVKKIGVHIVE